MAIENDELKYLTDPATRRIFDHFVENGLITTKDLNTLGYDGNDIRGLIAKEIIKHYKKGYYQLYDFEDLYRYGKTLLDERSFERAKKCFESFHYGEPEHENVCFQLILCAVRDKDYERIFKYIGTLFKNPNQDFRRDLNFYLLLISKITPLPKEYAEYLGRIDFYNMRAATADVRFTDVDAQNRVRGFAHKGEYHKAYDELLEVIKNEGKVSPSNQMIRDLLLQLKHMYGVRKEEIISLIAGCKYDEVIEAIEKKEKKSLTDQYCILLCGRIKYIELYKEVPNKRNTRTSDIFVAMDNEDYELALKLCIDYNVENKFDNNKSLLYLLLNKIVTLINSINLQNREKEVPSKPIEKKVELPIQEKPVEEEKSSFESLDKDLERIVGYLLSKDFENLESSLKEYLQSINRLEFMYIIINLIRISLYEKDYAFKKPISVLIMLKNKNFSLSLSPYLEELYTNLGANNFKIYRNYLDIIDKSNKLGKSNIEIQALIKVLEQNRQLLESKREPEEVIVFNEWFGEEDNKFLLNPEPVIDTIVEPVIAIDKPEEKGPDEVSKVEEKQNTAFNKIIEEVTTTKGLVILDPMSDEAISEVYNAIYDNPLIDTLIIEHPERRLVLRYRKIREGFVDYADLKSNAKAAYNSHDYYSCVEIWKDLLSVLDEPKPYLFYYIGSTYHKGGDDVEALKYFTIVKGLLGEKAEEQFPGLNDYISYLQGGDPAVREKTHKGNCEAATND